MAADVRLDIMPRRAWRLPTDMLVTIAENLTTQEKYTSLNRVCQEFHKVFQEQAKADKKLVFDKIRKEYGTELIRAAGGVDNVLRIPRFEFQVGDAEHDVSLHTATHIFNTMVANRLSLIRTNLPYSYHTFLDDEIQSKSGSSGTILALIKNLKSTDQIHAYNHTTLWIFAASVPQLIILSRDPSQKQFDDLHQLLKSKKNDDSETTPTSSFLSCCCRRPKSTSPTTSIHQFGNNNPTRDFVWVREAEEKEEKRND